MFRLFFFFTLFINSNTVVYSCLLFVFVFTCSRVHLVLKTRTPTKLYVIIMVVAASRCRFLIKYILFLLQTRRRIFWRLFILVQCRCCSRLLLCSFHLQMERKRMVARAKFSKDEWWPNGLRKQTAKTFKRTQHKNYVTDAAVCEWIRKGKNGI